MRPLECRAKEHYDDESNDDCELSTIEELLFTKLQAQGFTTGVQGPDKTGGVEEAADERGGSVDDQSRSTQSDNSGGSLGQPRPLYPPLWKWTANFPDSVDDLTVPLGDGDLSASEAEANDVGLRAESAIVPGAGLFDSPRETAIESMTTAPPCNSNGWHDIDDYPGTAPRMPLAEQGASTPDFVHPHTFLREAEVA